MTYAVKDWPRFQHYHGRRPPWIKLYRDLLDNFDFLTMQVASIALAPLLWLLASESDDGTFPGDADRLAFRLHRPTKEIAAALQELEQRGFIVRCKQDASGVLAERKQSACLETETETERETEKEGRKSRPFSPPTLEEVQAHCQAKGYTFDPEAFVAFYASKGWKVGNQPMRDWRACCVTWQKRDVASGKAPAPVAPSPGSLEALIEAKKRAQQEPTQ